MEQKTIWTKELVEKYHKPEKLLPYCQACKNYGLNYACPPNTIDMKEYLLSFSSADMFLVSVDVHSQERKQDALAIYAEAKDKFVASLLEIERLMPDSKAIILGGCTLCPTCLRVEGKPCKYPEKMRFNISAFSLEVTSLAKDLFEKEMQWFSAEKPNYLMLIGAILTNSPRGEKKNG